MAARIDDGGDGPGWARVDSANLRGFLSLFPMAEIAVTQIGAGPSQVSGTGALIGDVAVSRYRYGPDSANSVALSPAYVAFLIPLRWCGEFHFNGVAAATETVFMSSGPDGFFTRAEDRDVIVVAVPRRRFLETLAALRGVDPDEGLLCHGPLPLPMPVAMRLRAQLASLIEFGAAGRLGLGDDVAERLTGRLIDASLQMSGERAMPAGPAALRAVRRAETFFLAKAGRRVTLADICAAAGVGGSALNVAFRQVTGESPLRFLHKRRLMAARGALVSAEPGRAAVKQAALDAGLTELGRFAVEYRELFGEAPSVTLTAAAGLPPALHPSRSTSP